MSTKNKALLILADGAEEMEAVISTDVLRRAEIDVTVAGLNENKPICCSRQVKIIPDKSLKEALKSAPYDVIVLPGGLKGTENLSASNDVQNILRDQEQNNRWIAAICAGKLITSRGPGTAFDFALKIVEVLLGQEKSKAVRKPLVLSNI